MTASRNRSFRTQLGLECLQARVMPAVVVTQLDGDGAADDIRIVGDSANNVVTISDDAAGNLTVPSTPTAMATSPTRATRATPPTRTRTTVSPSTSVWVPATTP